MHLPETMSDLKADSLFYRDHASDADGRKNYSDTALFQEAYRHYIDIDIYPNYQSLPHDLDSMIMLYGRSTVRNNGTLPWAIVLTFDSLVAQLSRGNIAKAESTMSDLGHYVGDAHQPLHCTKNYDGDETGNDGIHSRYESSMINSFQSSIIINWDSVQYIASPLDYAFEFIYHSNSLVDSILLADDYAKSVSGWNGAGSPPTSYYNALWAKTAQFTKEQFQNATVALASLWYSAWLNAQPALYDTINVYSVVNSITTHLDSSVVQSGSDTSYTFTPQTGYHVDSIYVDGIKVDSITSYTFYSISSNHTITVWYSINTYIITANASPYGTLIPSGAIVLPYNNSQTFIITPDSGYTVDNVLIDGLPVDSTSSYTFFNVQQNHSIVVVFKRISMLIRIPVTGKWNMISIPLEIPDNRKTTLFPTSTSQAFAFNGSYVPKDSLTHGAGFWLKFDTSESITLVGERIDDDTIEVKAGWNLIGSTVDTILTTCIIFLSTTIESPFFGYDNGYTQSDAIAPGKAYWVKVSDDGQLILKNCGK